MNPLEEKVKQWLTEIGWRHVFFGDTGNWARFSVTGNNSDFLVTLIWYNKEDSNPNYFEVRTHFPIRVPQNKREKIANCLMILNIERHYTNFTLDYQDGEIMCKSVFFHEDYSVFNEAIFKSVYNMSIGSIDVVVPLITKLLYSDISIEQAIKEWSEPFKKL